MIVPVSVGPFENLTALNDCFTAVLQEIEFFRWITFSLVEQDALLFDHWKKFDGELARTVMVCEPLIVPHVPLEFGLGTFALRLFILELRVFLLLFVQITLIVSARC